MTASLTLEQYATAMAFLAFYETDGKDAVLKQLQVDGSAFRGSRDHWIDAMSGEFDDDDSPLATRFGASFSLAKADLDNNEPELKDAAPLVAAPKLGADFNPVDVTSATGMVALSDDTLPFEEGEGKAPPLAAVILDEPIDKVGLTQAMAALDVPDEVLPFEQIADLSLTQYASLCAELTIHPTDRKAIQRRYSVSNASQFSVLEKRYDDTFAANPALRVQFDQLVATYLQWLTKKDQVT